MARRDLIICGWTPKTVLLTIFITTVLFNECFIYIMQSFRWPHIDLPDERNYDKEQVILLVSDPQIQGYEFEGPFPLGALARWDIDRYLTRTFGLVYQHVQPDIILFLGDLMDEGSTATNEDYQYAYQRFQDVFSIAKYTKKIYIPGDNDVGGESRDFRTQKKVDRFVKHFENLTGVATFGFIDYIKNPEDMVWVIEPRKASPVHVLVSHFSVLVKDKMRVNPILQQVRPHLIFSGHWHKASVFLCNDCMKDDDFSWSVKERNLEDVQGWLVTNLLEKRFSITEIMVPTCSYRMGVSNIGYGVAVIKKNGELMYTVLWSPERYKMLYGYLISFVLCLLVFLYSRCCK